MENLNQEVKINPENERIREIFKRSKQFVVICGPSGSGKTMVIKYLVDRYGFIEPSFITTRELRRGEQEIGGISLSKDEFIKREISDQLFLPARNYGNAYGYDLVSVFKSAIANNNIVVEVPSINLITTVAHFLPNSTVIGMLPSTTEEIKIQLNHRGMDNSNDTKIRLASVDSEKENILKSSRIVEINQIIPTRGMPEDTISQIDIVMSQKGFKINK